MAYLNIAKLFFVKVSISVSNIDDHGPLAYRRSKKINKRQASYIWKTSWRGCQDAQSL